jgi:phage shock protein C
MTSPTPPPTPSQPQKRLTRSRDERMLAGVCGGLADYLGVDPTIVRLVAVLLGILSVGTAVIGYIIAAIIIPEAPDGG